MSKYQISISSIKRADELLKSDIKTGLLGWPVEKVSDQIHCTHGVTIQHTKLGSVKQTQCFQVQTLEHAHCIGNLDLATVRYADLNHKFSFRGYILLYPRFPSALASWSYCRVCFIVEHGRICLRAPRSWPEVFWVVYPANTSSWGILCLHAPSSWNH